MAKHDHLPKYNELLNPSLQALHDLGGSGVSQASPRVALQIKDDKKLKPKTDKIILDLNLSTV